jgi:2-polyprenyl-3-methyl-5-hydroxy-6-metoxy-1,4-benzoquinol methylase
MSINSEEQVFIICPICSSSIRTWRIKIVDGVSYKLDACNSCGYSFVNPRPSLDLLMNYYSSNANSHSGITQQGVVSDLKSVLAQEKIFPNSTIDARRIITTIKSIKSHKNGKFLDVGSGYGFFSKEALDQGFEVDALELSEGARKISEEMTGLNPVACSFEEFQSEPGSFQAILMSQILEHAFDVNLWISKSRSLLIDGGIIAIAVPNYGSIFRKIMQENESFICPPEHLNFFNLFSLSKLLENHGFRVEVTQYFSKIPKSAFEKNLPKIGKPLLPVINLFSSLFLKVIDALHLGMFINVYGRKI